jgi:integrase
VNEFTESWIVRFESEQRFSTAKRYRTMMLHLMAFSKNKKLKLSDIDSQFVLNFRSYLYKNITTSRVSGKPSVNTVVNYLKVLKALLNKAKDMEYYYGDLPFGLNTIPNQTPTDKKSLKLEEMWKLDNLTPAHPEMRPLLCNSLNIFMFCFWSQGIRIGDCLQLRWRDLDGDFFKINMDKTDRYLNFPLNSQNVDRLKWNIKDWIPIWDWNQKKWNLGNGNDSHGYTENGGFLSELRDLENTSMSFQRVNELEIANQKEKNAIVEDYLAQNDKMKRSGLLGLTTLTQLSEIKDIHSRDVHYQMLDTDDLVKQLEGIEPETMAYKTLKSTIDERIKRKEHLELLYSNYISALSQMVKEYAKSHPDEFVFPFMRGFEKKIENSDIEGWRRFNNKVNSSIALINKSLVEISEKVNVTRFTCHFSRHTLATYLKSMGSDVYDLKNWLGHTSVKTTERYIDTLNPYTFNKVIGPLKELMNQKMGINSDIK